MRDRRSGSARALAAGAAALAAAALCACGPASPGRTASGAHGWNTADACKTLDKSAVAKATGMQVKDVSGTAPAGYIKGAAAVSSCTYQLTGGVLSLMTRVAPDPLSDAEIATMTTGGGLLPPAQPEPGLGEKAFWTPQTGQLQVFPDRRRYLNITYGAPLGAPAAAGPDRKAVAVALAKTLV